MTEQDLLNRKNELIKQIYDAHSLMALDNSTELFWNYQELKAEYELLKIKLGEIDHEETNTRKNL